MTWAFIHPGDWERVSGGYVYDRALTEALRRQNIPVTLIGLPPDASLQEIKRVARDLSSLEPSVILQDQLSFRALTPLNHAVKGLAPRLGLIHVPSGFLARGFWKRQALRFQECRHAATLDGALFVSEPTATAARGYLRIKKASCILPPGHDHLPPHENKALQTEGTQQFLFAGRVAPEKGLERLLPFLNALSAHLKWHLTVAGPVEDRRLQQALLHFGARWQTPRVSFAGSLTPEKLRALYAATDFLLLPSPYESFSLVAMEAMGHGVPVVSWAQGGPTSFIRHGINGFRFETGQNSANVKYFEHICLDPVQTQTMREHARATFLSFPRWDVTAQRLIAFVTQEVLHEK